MSSIFPPHLWWSVCGFYSSDGEPEDEERDEKKVWNIIIIKIKTPFLYIAFILIWFAYSNFLHPLAVII